MAKSKSSIETLKTTEKLWNHLCFAVTNGTVGEIGKGEKIIKIEDNLNELRALVDTGLKIAQLQSKEDVEEEKSEFELLQESLKK